MTQPGKRTDGPGPIALVGGDEFQGPAAAFDRLLVSLAPQPRPAVAILPTAAIEGNPYLTAEHGVRHFEQLETEPYPVMMLDQTSANDEALIDELRRADIVYFSGGKPTHLLESMRGSAAWACIVELSQRGAIVAGSSAGAMMLGERMAFRGQAFAGLAAVPGVVVLPHFERSSRDRVARLRASLPPELTLLGIAGATGCVRHDGEWHVDGPGEVSVITSTGAQVFSAGARFTLP